MHNQDVQEEILRKLRQMYQRAESYRRPRNDVVGCFVVIIIDVVLLTVLVFTGITLLTANPPFVHALGPNRANDVLVAGLVLYILLAGIMTAVIRRRR